MAFFWNTWETCRLKKKARWYSIVFMERKFEEMMKTKSKQNKTAEAGLHVNAVANYS